MGLVRAVGRAVGKPELDLRKGSRRTTLPAGKDRVAIGEAPAA
jgi:hypothetical protein